MNESVIKKYEHYNRDRDGIRKYVFDHGKTGELNYYERLVSRHCVVLLKELNGIEAKWYEESDPSHRKRLEAKIADLKDLSKWLSRLHAELKAMCRKQYVQKRKAERRAKKARQTIQPKPSYLATEVAAHKTRAGARH